MSQRVCAKILEFVFGRSIATNSLEEVGIVFRTACWNTQFSRINPVGNSRSDLQPVEGTSHCGKGQPNSGEKFLVVEWLGEKSGRARFQGGGTDERIVFSGEHDDARRRRKLPQPRLN